MRVMEVGSPWIWCNGEWIPEDDFSIHQTDRGLLHGMAAFETMRAENGQLRFADQHLARFSATVSSLGLANADLTSLSEIVTDLCQRNLCQRGLARIRLTATAGSGPPDACGVGKYALCWISAAPWRETAESVVCGLLPWRKNSNSPLKGIKSACYAENLLALRHAKERGWNEGIFLNENSEICEAIMANLFMQFGDEIVTPPLSSGCLPGVMRGVILANGLAKEAELLHQDVHRADALWLSSSLRGLIPVASLDSVEKKQNPFPYWELI